MRVANAFSSSSSSVSRSSNSVRALVEEIAVSVEDLARCHALSTSLRTARSISRTVSSLYLRTGWSAVR